LYLRCRLVKPPIGLVRRRIIVLVLLTWLPLALLSTIEGLSVTGVEVPFLTDIGPHVQFLLALPMLVVAYRIVHRWIPLSVDEFVSRDLVAPAERPRFDEAIASSVRLRDSTAAEIVVLILSALAGSGCGSRSSPYTRQPGTRARPVLDR